GFMEKLVSTRDKEGNMGQCKVDEFRALSGESSRVEYPSFGVAQGVLLADFFKVSLLTPVDIDNFIRDLDSDKFEVWSMLTKEQRDGVIDIVGVLLDSLLSNDNDITKEKPSDPIVQSVDINPTPTSYVGAAGASTIGQAKVVEKVSLHFEHTLYGYFIGKRIAFSVVEYFVQNNWAKHGLTRIMMNSKEDGISLIATFIGKPIMLDSYTSAMCNDSHVHDQCPKKVVSPSITTTSNGVTYDVTPTVVMPNDGFQTVGKKKKKGKGKSTNASQFVGPSVKHNFRYEPKAETSQPKKGATNVGNATKSSPKLKSTNTSSKEGSIATSNSYSALENDEEEDEEHVENVYDESANLFPTSKAGERSSFTVGVG
ncbi:hypothetical protein Tco_0246233, partial [Tanacetum coccineum]